MSRRAIGGAIGEDGQSNLKTLTIFAPYLNCLMEFENLVERLIMADDNGKPL